MKPNVNATMSTSNKDLHIVKPSLSTAESTLKPREPILKAIDNNLSEKDCNKVEKNYTSKIPSSDKFIKSKLSTSELELNHGGEGVIGK
jgi:hypothetical protein